MAQQAAAKRARVEKPWEADESFIPPKDWRVEDDAYIAEEDEDKYDLPRCFYIIKACPLPNCSSNAWSRVRCMSYKSAEDCLDKLQAHAKASSLHKMKSVDAEEMVKDPDIIDKVEVEHETKQDIEKYRQWADAEYLKACRQKWEAYTRSKQRTGKGKGGGKTPVPPATPPPVLQMQLDGGSTNAIARPSQSAAVQLPGMAVGAQITLLDSRVKQEMRVSDDITASLTFREMEPRQPPHDVSHVLWNSMTPRARACKIHNRDGMARLPRELLKDSLRRAHESSTNSAMLCAQLAQQFQNEARVTGVAHNVVEQTLNEAISRAEAAGRR